MCACTQRIPNIWSCHQSEGGQEIGRSTKKNSYLVNEGFIEIFEAQVDFAQRLASRHEIDAGWLLIHWLPLERDVIIQTKPCQSLHIIPVLLQGMSDLVRPTSLFFTVPILLRFLVAALHTIQARTNSSPSSSPFPASFTHTCATLNNATELRIVYLKILQNRRVQPQLGQQTKHKERRAEQACVQTPSYFRDGGKSRNPHFEISKPLKP